MAASTSLSDPDEMTDPLSPDRTVELYYTLARKDLSHMIRAVYRSGRMGWLLGPVGAVVILGCRLYE